MLKQIVKTARTLEFLVFSAMVPYGEYIQNQTIAGEQPYSWAVGHVTDIGMAGGLTLMTYMALQSKSIKIVAMIPTALSTVELVTAIHPKINFDWQDIVCYYSSALIAYGTNKIYYHLNK